MDHKRGQWGLAELAERKMPEQAWAASFVRLVDDPLREAEREGPCDFTTMITGRWGKPFEVLLDLVVEEDGSVWGVANSGRQNAPIRHGHFDARDGAVTPPLLTTRNRLKARIAGLIRWINARTRPTGEENARQLRKRDESLDSIIFRDAVAADIPALAELHVTTWNATYNTTRGPTIATRTWQWNEVFAKEKRRDFVLVLEDRNGRLIGFTFGRPTEGEFEGELSKIYLRWEYHGLGLGPRMMAETARRFLDRGIHSFILFAELSNPTLGFYDRLGGERLFDERGQFGGAFGWRDVRTLIR